MEPRAYIGERKKRTAIDARLTMDVDHASSRLTQKGVKHLLELGIPVKKVVIWRIGCIHAEVATGIFVLKPPRAIVGMRAVDDMADPALVHEPGREKGSGANENACMEVGRRVSKVVWHGSQHYTGEETWL